MIIGTAGHIDHGKTSLVKALTGIDADRLKEEKARGITIDLGFAYAPLPSGEMLGFVDVPGHERLMHNMLAGATGIDFALLVIAADDGLMPQTREHAVILDLLGIARGAVALTKTDRVPAERIAAASAEVRSLLAGTGLADSPLFPLSAISGHGVPELSAYLERVAHGLPARNGSGHFRLAVDRVFTLDGKGTIVTGTAFSGEVRVGDTLVISPQGEEVRVRSIHAQNRPCETGRAGQRCALNLTGAQLDRADIRRGDWVLEPPIHLPLQRFDAQIRVLASEQKPLKHWTPVHLHLGALDVTARVALLESDTVEPGHAALAQIVTDKPICTLNGDRFIVRDQSASRTLGGGQAIDPFPPTRHRRTPARIAELRAMQQASPAAALRHALEHSSCGVNLTQFAQARNIRLEEAQALGNGLPMYVVSTPSVVAGFGLTRWAELKQATLDRLALEHQQATDSLGPDRTRLHRMTHPALARPVYSAMLDELLADGRIAQSGPWLHLPEHKAAFSATEEKLWPRVLPLLQAEPFHPPRVRDIARSLVLEENAVRMLLRQAARAGEVYLVAHDHYFTKDAVKSLSAIVGELATANDCTRAAEFRDRIGVGRKLAIQILEFFDRIGYTRRTGDEHRLRQESHLF